MKPHLIITFLVALCFSATAQQVDIREVGPWQINSDGSVKWQHIYDNPEITITDIVSHLRRYSWIRDIVVDGATIYATSDDYIFDHSKYKIGTVFTPTYTEGKWDWATIIEVKEGRYRVTLESFFYDYHDFKNRTQGPFEQLILKRDRRGFRHGYLSNLEAFGTELKSNFEVKRVQTTDW